MISQFFKLSLALVLCFVGWVIYERSHWEQDYSKYDAPKLPLYPLDHTFQQHINPKLFQNATIISNDTHLRYPEDLAVSNDGTVYTGLLDGSVVSVNPQDKSITTLFKHNDSGRILGIILTSDESTLYYVSQFRGLIKLDIKSLQPQYLLQKLDSQKLGALNNLCIDQDTQILYITESTPISMAFSNKQMMLRHNRGRILAFSLQTQTTEVLLQDLAFPNGIVYEKKTNSIIFSELTRLTIWKYEISTGKKTALVQNLFGYADNLKLNQKGQLCVGIPAARDAHLQFLNEHPQIRKLLIYLPERLVYSLVKKRAGGIKIDTTTGQITDYIFGAPTKASFLTTMLEKNGKIYFGSLRSSAIIVLNATKKETIANTADNVNVVNDL